MSDNETDDPTADRSTETNSLQTPVTSAYKFLGQLSADSGVGVLGQNDAGSGTPTGVKSASRMRATALYPLIQT